MKFLRLLPFLTAVLSAQTLPIDGFAASVNGRIITAGDVLEATQAARRDAQRRFSGQELARQQARIFESGLEQLIEQRLILEAFEAGGGTLPDGAVRDRANTVLRERFQNNRTEFLSALRLIGKSEREWENEIREQIILQQMTQQFVTRRLHVTPRMLQERYEANPERFTRPVEARVQAISLRPVPEADLPARRELLQDLRNQILDGADFGELARQHSQGSHADRGGDMGWMNPASLPEMLRNAITALEPGEISEPLITPTQHFLLKVLERRGGDIQPLAEVQADLESELRREQFDEIHEEWIESLRRRFPVVRFRPDDATIQRRN